MYKQFPIFYACCGCGGWNGCGWNCSQSCNSCNNGCGTPCRTVYITTVSGPAGGTGTTGGTGSTGSTGAPSIPDITLDSVLMATNTALTDTGGPIPLTVSNIYPTGSTGITVAGSTATLAEPGLYEIIYNVNATGAGAGAIASLYVNDVQIPSTVRDLQAGPAGATYLVNTTSANTSVQLQLGAATGITGGTANLYIKKYGLPTPTIVYA